MLQSLVILSLQWVLVTLQALERWKFHIRSLISPPSKMLQTWMFLDVASYHGVHSALGSVTFSNLQPVQESVNNGMWMIDDRQHVEAR